MASEWATSKAIKVWPESQWYLRLGRDGDIERIAAALDEAQERGGKEALVKAVPLKELPLKLGHEFVPYRGYFVESKVCIFLGCGQPREAH